jgi:ABC-2 type transport system ATP-binding protein
LKANFMPEDVWELEVGEFNEAVEALKENPRFSEVAVFGNVLHVLVHKGDDPSAIIPQILAKHAIPVRRLEKIAPTLEDVFVSLVEAKSR